MSSGPSDRGANYESIRCFLVTRPPAVTIRVAGHPLAGYLVAGHPPAGHPAAGNPPARHPSAGQSPAGHPPARPPTAGHPPVGHPPARHPATGHPPAGHPAAAHPPTGHPIAGHLPAGHPSAGYPVTGHPPAGQPIPGHLVTGRPAAGHLLSGHPPAGYPPAEHTLPGNPPAGHPLPWHPPVGVPLPGHLAARDSNALLPIHSGNDYFPHDDDFATYHVHRLRAVRNMLEVVVGNSFMPYVGEIEDPGNEVLRYESVLDSYSDSDSTTVSSSGDESNQSDSEETPPQETTPMETPSQETTPMDTTPMETPSQETTPQETTPQETPSQESPSQETTPQENMGVVKEPPAKQRKTKKTRNTKTQDGDAETCPICLDIWGNSGAHRLVSLKCGHLFGAECVERWLKAQPVQERTCPTCKSKASIKEIRCIYARKVIAADTTEITRLRSEVETLQANNSRNELNLQAAKVSQRALLAQLEELRSKIASHQATHGPEKNHCKFGLERNLEVSKDGGCRVLAYNCRSLELLASQKSANYLFPGFGIRKISCVDYTLGQFVHLHSKPIRGIVYSQPNDMLLSVSLDGTAKILERGMPNITLNVGSPLWSCAWDHCRPNEFYVGGYNGTIRHYDVRNLSRDIYTISGMTDKTPAISLCSTQYGLLSCHLNSCWLWESVSGQWVPKIFPVNGACLSMCYDAESHRAMVSLRAKPPVEPSKLTVCSLIPNTEGRTNVVVDYVIKGSTRTTYMAKSTFCRIPGATWLAVHSECDSMLYLHGLDGTRTMKLAASETALDVISAEVNGFNILASLSENRCRIYKAL